MAVEGSSDVRAGQQGVDVLGEGGKSSGGEIVGHTRGAVAGMIVTQNAISGIVEAFYNVVPEAILRRQTVGEKDSGSGRLVGVGELVRDGSPRWKSKGCHFVSFFFLLVAVLFDSKEVSGQGKIRCSFKSEAGWLSDA